MERESSLTCRDSLSRTVSGLCMGISGRSSEKDLWSLLSLRLTQYERERQVWLLGPRIQDPEHKDQAMRIVDEEAESSGEETVIEMDSHQDTEMISHDIGTASDEIGYTAEDEASNQEYETTDQEYERPTTCIPIRRRSAPTPYSTRMYDIDTSEFRECADEDPEYRSTGGRREEHCLHTDKDKQTQTILNNARSQINYASPIGIYHNGGTLLEEEWVGFCNRRSLKVEDMSLRRRIVADVVERWLWRRSNRNVHDAICMFVFRLLSPRTLASPSRHTTQNQTNSTTQEQKSSKPTTTLLTILPLTKPTPSTSKKGFQDVLMQISLSEYHTARPRDLIRRTDADGEAVAWRGFVDIFSAEDEGLPQSDERLVTRVVCVIDQRRNRKLQAFHHWLKHSRT
ncbi:hypothetical protein KCU69_g13, partial [Aureobasidium melanogenum]